MKGGNGSRWSTLGPATRCTLQMLRNAHCVIGSATKSAVACPRYNPGNAVPLQLSDNGIRRVSVAFINNGV